jgi:hypothetical protein
MNQKLFISYSRRQTPFVDRLVDQLEDSGYPLWLDYQSLVPAKPWYEQIESGVTEADVVLLVVSRDSLGSKHVEPEWKLALTLKKRIVLVIFEAIPLPPELQGCEWVDFRVRYSRSIRKLMNMLEKPEPVTAAPPQSGFKAPKRFWLALILSVVVVIGSIPSWWTLFVPYVLIPLPWQIYKRNYIFSRIIPALLLLPLFLIFTSAIFFQKGSILFGLQNFTDAWLVPATLASWALLVLLLTPVMQRRALPEAARVRFANPLAIEIKKPRSVVFTIDHALEDGRYADDLQRGLERHGHRMAQAGETPEAAFVLISTYKTSTSYDPNVQAVYPVLLQAVENIDPVLQRIQWIDFRNGIHNINRLAKLLPEPERLLKALAVPPTGTQEIFPLVVNSLQFFYLLTGILGGGGLLTSLLSLGALLWSGELGQEQIIKLFSVTINGVLLFGAVLYSVKGLRSRRGGTSAIYPLLILTIFQAILHISNFLILTATERTDDNLLALLTTVASGPLLAILAFPFGLVLALPFLLFFWRDLYRWLPRHQGSSVDCLESLLLLYTPQRRRVLVFHVLFHFLLLLTYIALSISNSTSLNWVSFLYASPVILILYGIRHLARRVSTKAVSVSPQNASI